MIFSGYVNGFKKGDYMLLFYGFGEFKLEG